jgi:serine/threonine protein kinase
VQDEVAGDSAEASDGSAFETWLRKAARFPSDVPRVTLPEPGQVVAEKYRIESQLGRGGMGAVYLATHLVSGKQVALKWMLRPGTSSVPVNARDATPCCTPTRHLG